MLHIFSQDSRFDGGPQCGAGQGPLPDTKGRYISTGLFIFRHVSGILPHQESTFSGHSKTRHIPRALVAC